MLDISKMKHIGLFAGGVLFGTAGVKVLASKDAKKLYTGCTAAASRISGLLRLADSSFFDLNLFLIT